MPDKLILVVPREKLFSRFYFNGFVNGKAPLDFGTEMLWSYRPRLERNDNYKQIIPYVVFTHGVKVFTYVRSNQATEERLHNLRSIGIGGHIKEEVDRRDTLTETILVAMGRELEEEISIDWGPVSSISEIGYLNDDSNPVGRVHLGIVFQYKLDSEQAASLKLKGSDGLIDAKWMTYEELSQEPGENWTRLLYPAILQPNKQ